MRDAFNVSEDELFKVWVDYNKRRKVGFSARIITHLWRKSLIREYYRAIDYYTAVGLELFNKEYMEVLNGKSMDKSE